MGHTAGRPAPPFPLPLVPLPLLVAPIPDQCATTGYLYLLPPQPSDAKMPRVCVDLLEAFIRAGGFFTPCLPLPRDAPQVAVGVL